MDITKTNYGLLVTIPEQHDTNGDLLNSEFTYQLRQVRTINDNDPDEQPLINALEKGEKRDTAKFLKLAGEMEQLFKQLKTREDWQAWEDEHGDFNRLYHDRIDELAEKINGYSFTYAEHSKHGYCV